jgi:hypothetical protein
MDFFYLKVRVGVFKFCVDLIFKVVWFFFFVSMSYVVCVVVFLILNLIDNYDISVLIYSFLL